MKTVAILFVCAFMACLFNEAKADCPPLDGEPGPSVKTGTEVEKDCAIHTCQEDGGWFTPGCPAWQCRPGHEVGYRKLDKTKPYPDCCEGPICDPNA